MVNSTKNIVPVIGIMYITCSCGLIPIYKYRDLTCYNKQFASGQIRTDGYFATRYNGTLYDEDTEFIEVICFYDDGFYFSFGAFSMDDTTLTRIANVFPKKRLEESKDWGVYYIENDRLIMQEFSSGLYPKIYAPAFEYFSVLQSKGMMSNSEKFVVFEYSFRGDTIKSNDIYQFYPCIDCKPDSTNWLRTNKKLNKMYSRIE